MDPMKKLPPRRVKPRRHLLGSAAAAGFIAVVPPAAAGLSASDQAVERNQTAYSVGAFELAQGGEGGGEGGEAGHTMEGGEGGEAGHAMEGGEGGESGHATEGGEGGEGGSAGADGGNVGFLADLAYVQGHLLAGMSLYESRKADMAGTHMKHPEDEIYTALKPQIEAHGGEQFDAQLAALAAAVQGGAPVDEAKAAHEEVVRAIEAAREQAGFGPGDELKAIGTIIREAAREYDIAVEDGAIVNLPEYQDAWGFVQVARKMLEELRGSESADVEEAITKIEKQFQVIDPVFPGPIPTEDALVEPEILFGAAARMELAGLAVK